MDKLKLSLYISLLVSFFILIGFFVYSNCGNNCKDSIPTLEQNVIKDDSTTACEKKYEEEIRQRILSYTSNFTDSINKQDSIYSNHLKEIKSLFKRKAQEKKSNDSCIDCICPNTTTYEFNYRDYHKLQEKISHLQKNISSRKNNIKTQEKLIEYIIRNHSNCKTQKNNN